MDGGDPAARRDIRPRGHRGASIHCSATMCVFVRDLIVFGVLTDMMRGRPAVYATFSSYDEVAHHSGLERADTLEALRKVDQQFGRIERARRFAPRPYEIVALSDHGQTQGATFKQRNGYGLDELVERTLGGRRGDRPCRRRRAERDGWPRDGGGHRQKGTQEAEERVSDRQVVVLGSGNLGLVYLMGGAPPPDHGGDRRAPPRADPGAPRPSPRGLDPRHSESVAPSRWRAGAHYLAEGRIEGEDPLAVFAPTTPTICCGPTASTCRRHHGRELLRPGHR